MQESSLTIYLDFYSVLPRVSINFSFPFAFNKPSRSFPETILLNSIANCTFFLKSVHLYKVHESLHYWLPVAGSPVLKSDQSGVNVVRARSAIRLHHPGLFFNSLDFFKTFPDFLTFPEDLF